MTKKITSYEELLVEKKRLQSLVQAQKELLRYDIEGIKLQFKPLMDTASFIGKITTRDKTNPLLNMGISSVIDLVFKNVLLAKAGWLGRRIIPFVLKNYSSHIIDDNIEGIKDKVTSFIKKFSRNGRKEAE